MSSEEDEPLMKSVEPTRMKESADANPAYKEYQKAWHPVKFDYKTVGELNFIEGVEIYEHKSDVTFVLTIPTGFSNKSFTSSISTQKTADRMLPDVWENSRVEQVSGFFVKNTKREGVRIQTDDGCAFCKGNDSCWVWADSILRVFPSDKSIDWPKWTMYPKSAE